VARPQPSVPLSEAVDEFLQWMELGRHRIAGTVARYRDELARFQEFVDEHGQAIPRWLPWLGLPRGRLVIAGRSHRRPASAV